MSEINLASHSDLANKRATPNEIVYTKFSRVLMLNQHNKIITT